MKEPGSWQEEDLLQLIHDKREESIELDYKRADALQASEGKKTEISKDVSAFANSIGGTILYGMEEHPDEPHHATALSPIDPSASSKEWLEQVINSRVQPRIPGVLINPIELKQRAPGKFAGVVMVPESTTAHQASDKRYYKRFNFQSVPMEDYEVRQTMNRASRPAYTVRLDRFAVSTASGGEAFQFRAVVENLSEIVGHEVSAVLFVPREFVLSPDDYTTDIKGTPYTRMFSNYAESSAVLRSAIPSAHPLTPYSVSFVRELSFGPYPPPSLRFTVFVRIFDQFGLALTATFGVIAPGCAISLVRQTYGAKRSSGALSIAPLE
jgi:hypothetical protein